MELLEGITLREGSVKSRLTTSERWNCLKAFARESERRTWGPGASPRPENIFLSRPDVLELVKITDFGIQSLGRIR
jgi:hypothetical protein